MYTREADKKSKTAEKEKKKIKKRINALLRTGCCQYEISLGFFHSAEYKETFRRLGCTNGLLPNRPLLRRMFEAHQSLRN